MQRRFNLIDECWLPMSNYGRVSLRTLFTQSELTSPGGTPPEKIAILKLLLAICQAANTPKDIDDWLELSPQILAQQCLSYLEKWYDRFWLYGDMPFLQMPAASAAEIKSFGTIMPDVATGNTSVLTEYHNGSPLDDGQKALLLLVQMGMALSGKKTDNSLILSPGYRGKTNEKGKPATGKVGPSVGYLGYLHSFATGDTLWETLWFNLLTEDDIAEIHIYSEGTGRPPWEQMPQGEDCPVARKLKNSLMGRLIPLCRFMLLTDNGLHLTEGLAHLGHKEGMFDPSITIINNGKEQKAVWVDPQKRPWRELPALLGHLSENTNTKTQCNQLHYALEHAYETNRRFGLWTGGIRVSSNAGEQYLSGKDDIVESVLTLNKNILNDRWFDRFTNEMQILDRYAKTTWRCVENYFKQMNSTESKSLASVASQQFWLRCELQAQNLLFYCEDTPENNHQEQLEKLHKLFYSYIQEIYNETCPCQTPKQIAAWAKHHPGARKNVKGEQ